jgi:hypothetical protein
MVFKRLRNARKRWNKSKIGSKINAITGNRYGRGWKQIATKGVPQMARDVAMLKSMVNAEKKRYVISSTQATAIGQVNANASGYMAIDITPVPGQSNTYDGRQGASVKLHSSYMKFQFYHQASTAQNIKLKMFLVHVTGAPVASAATFLGQMFQQNSFVSPGITDYNSQLNPDYFKQYRILRTRTVSLPPDSISGVQVIKEVAIPIRFRNHHIRFNKDTNTVTSGQLLLFIFADSGNISSGSASTCTPIPVTAVSTGCVTNYNLTYYYYDN